MCNCNRRHKAVTSATLEAARQAASQEERERASVMNAIGNANSTYPDVPTPNVETIQVSS